MGFKLQDLEACIRDFKTGKLTHLGFLVLLTGHVAAIAGIVEDRPDRVWHSRPGE